MKAYSVCDVIHHRKGLPQVRDRERRIEQLPLLLVLVTWQTLGYQSPELCQILSPEVMPLPMTEASPGPNAMELPLCKV